MTAYRVTGAQIVAATENRRIIHLLRGDTVPAGVTPETIAHLLSLGYIEPEDAPTAPPSASSPKK